MNTTIENSVEQNSDASRVPTSVIAPASGWALPDFGEVWKYRDLLGLLVWRDVSARYRQSIVGFGWAIIRPVVTMLIFTFIFGSVAKLDSGNAPAYALFCFCGIVPWGYFSTALTSSTASLVSGRNLLTKVYFPRIILPISSVVLGLVDLAIQLVLVVVLMFYFGVVPTVALLMLPVFVLISVLAAFTGGVWLTVLNVKYRDVGHAVPFMIQSMMWLSPIVYLTNSIPEQYRIFYRINPMVSVIDGFRWAIYGAEQPDWFMMGVSTSIILVVLFAGLIYFRKMESTFADVI